MKEEILRLRKEGHSYNYICSKLQCSKSTIAYHCNDEYRESAQIRHKDNKIKGDPLWSRSYKWNRRSVNVKQIREFIEDKFKSKCYLSGREVNLDSASSFHFDHIVPKSKGGTNELDNLGVCTPEVNAAKGDLSVEEFIELCKDVLNHNGYTVKK